MVVLFFTFTIYRILVLPDSKIRVELKAALKAEQANVVQYATMCTEKTGGFQNVRTDRKNNQTEFRTGSFLSYIYGRLSITILSGIRRAWLHSFHILPHPSFPTSNWHSVSPS